MKLIAQIAALSTLMLSAHADLLLEDLFDNNNLGSSSQLNGGFGIIGNGSGDVTESGSVATISNSSNKNDYYGMLSLNSISSSALGSGEAMVTHWYISDSDLKAKTSSLIFTWQTDNSLTLAPEIGVHVDLNTEELQLFVNSTNNILDQISLDADFGDSGDTFSLTATFTETGFVVAGAGSLSKSGSSTNLLAGSWGVTPKGFEDYQLGAVVNANGSNGLIVDVDSVSVDVIPEPAVAGLITIFGVGLIGYRRIFGRNNDRG